MRRRDGLLLSVAIILSLGLHTAVGYKVMKLPIGRPRPVFTHSDTRVEQAVEVARAPEDQIIDDTGKKGPETSQPAKDAPDPIKRAMDELLQQEIQKKPPPSEPPTPALDGIAKPKLSSPPATSVATGASGSPPDLTKELMTLADPEVTLPEFKPTTDGVETTASSELSATLGPGGRLADVGSLNQTFGTGTSPVTPARLESLPIPVAAAGGDGSGSGGGGGGEAGTSSPPDASATSTRSAESAASPTEEGEAKTTDPSVLDLPEVKHPEKVSAAEPSTSPPVHLDDDFSYTLRTYRGRVRKKSVFETLFGGERSAPKEGWFEAEVTPKRSLRRLDPLKKDVVYAIDTSASITDRWIGRVKHGVRRALTTFNDGDRFNLLLFKDGVQILNEGGLVEATPGNIDAARDFLQTASSSGWTDVNQALSKLLVQKTPPDRVYEIVLISDGRPTRGAVDPKRIINMITRENNRVASIYCVGVGDEINKKLLEFLAYRNKGRTVYAENVGEAASTIRELAGRLRYPLVKNLRYSILGVDPTRVYPRALPDIYQDQPLSLLGRYDSRTKQITVRISGTNREEKLDLTFTLKFDEAADGTAKIAKQWAFRKLHHLYARKLVTGPTDELEQEMRNLERRYGIEAAY